MRTIIEIEAHRQGKGVRLVATFEDGTTGVLMGHTRRTYGFCAVHAKRWKSGATSDCPEASYVSFHTEARYAVSQGRGDVVVQVIPIYPVAVFGKAPQEAPREPQEPVQAPQESEVYEGPVVECSTAEGWCSAVVAAYTPQIEALGYTVPKVVISPGFTSGGSRKTQRLGECWSSEAAGDGSTMIFLNPSMSDPLQIAHVVVHELVHAVVGVEHKHDATFGKLARALGFEGKLTATTWSVEAAEACRKILQGLGPYPRSAFGAALKPPTKKQQTYLLKVECPECGYTMRVTSKWIEIATPTCPCCDVACAVAGRKEG